MLAYSVKNYMLTKKEYILTNKIFILYPVLYTIILNICTAIYLICLYKCMDICYETFILPLVKKIGSFFTNCKTAIVNMSGFGEGSKNLSNHPTPEPNPSPNPEPNPLASSDGVSQKNKKKKRVFSEKPFNYDRECIKLKQGAEKLVRIGGNHDTEKERRIEFTQFKEKYFKWLPKDQKKKAQDLHDQYEANGLILHKGYAATSSNLQQYWSSVQNDSRTMYRNYTQLFEIFEVNSKKIKNDSLGGPNSTKSKQFNQELTNIKILYSENFNAKNVIVKDLIQRSYKMDAFMKKNNIPFISLFENGVLR